MARTESPIELSLLVALLKEVGQVSPGPAGTVCRLGPWVLTTQRPEGSYRIDLALESSHARLAVEADGHDFHERTAEQAMRDRSRDRWMQGDGWRVLRFTGREIWRDATACADEILGHLAAPWGNKGSHRERYESLMKVAHDTTAALMIAAAEGSSRSQR